MYTRWWIQIFFIFTSIWGRFPFWLIFFKRVKPPTSMVYLPTYLPLAKNVQTIHVGQFLPVPWMIWISNRSIEVPALHPSPPNVGSTPLEFCALISCSQPMEMAAGTRVMSNPPSSPGTLVASHKGCDPSDRIWESYPQNGRILFRLRILQ